MKFLLTFLALFILSLGFGQNVRLSGTCVGKKNIPIQGVSIQLVTPNKVLNQVTDSLGFYSFIVQKGDSVQLLFVYDDLR